MAYIKYSAHEVIHFGLRIDQQITVLYLVLNLSTLKEQLIY